MKLQFKQILAFIFIALPMMIEAQTYGGNVGDYISLPEPSLSGGYEIYSAQYYTSSNYLAVASGTSSVKILSYFTGYETVRCDYYCVRQYSVAGRIYQDFQSGTAYYSIYCIGGSTGGGSGGGSNNNGWVREGNEYVCTVNTEEGVPMKFALESNNNQTCCPYGDAYDVSCIDRNYSGKVTIPTSVKGYRVWAIGAYSFQDCTKLTSVTMPASITAICVGAFRKCTSMTSVNIPSSVIRIEVEAFYMCRGLTSVTIPNSVEYIEANAFYGCNNIESIVLGENVKSIGRNAFDCNSLTTITSLRETPPTIKDAPGYYYKNWIVYVPSKYAKTQYEKAAYWKDCKEIRVIGEDDAAGIEDIKTPNNSNAPAYNLSGQKVTSPAKDSIYIVNGKKYVVK